MTDLHHKMPEPNCPRCQSQWVDDGECLTCGVVVSKYLAMPVIARPKEPTPRPRSGSRSTLVTALLVALAISGSIFVADAIRRQAEPVDRLGEARQAPRSLEARTDLRVATADASHPVVTRVLPAGYSTDDSPPPTEAEAEALTPDFSWYEGAEGMNRAVQEAREDGRPIAVYFYTDWCGYCRQLERDLLERAKVEDFMKYMTKVRINPEKSPNNRFIAQRYGVSGFPTFFVHTDGETGPTKVSRMIRDGGEYRLKTQDEFIDSLQSLLDG